MTSTTAADLPQLDASSLVDADRLEREIKGMYRHVARREDADLHFEIGRSVAEGLGFVYTNNGIDADFGGTGVENGSATCYLVYTRLQ